MGVKMVARYEGELGCVVEHGPSGDALATDAPADNHGRGAHFSPTDLVGAALGACMLTTMGIAAVNQGLELGRPYVEVEKEMGSAPRRHIARLLVVLHLPAAFPPSRRPEYEAIAHGCPVAMSLAERTRVELRVVYDAP